jgi:hypothetical protein
MTQANREYALTNGRVFIGDSLRDNLAIHVKGDRVAAVCEPAALPPDITSFDVRGCAIVPGLIDVHTHSEEWHLPLFLAHGVTTVRDTGCDLEVALDRRERWNKPDAVAPRFVCCGPLIDGGGAPHKRMMAVATTAEEGAAYVDQFVAAGVDQIKMYAWLDWPAFEGVLKRSQHYGKFTLAHMQNYVDARRAVLGGLDEIEHCSGCAEAMYPERGRNLEPWRKIFPDQTRDQQMQLIDLLVERGTWMAVTRVIWYKLSIEWEPHLWDAPSLRYAPRHLLAWWKGRKPEELTREYRLDWARAYGALQIFTANLIERGARIIAGSDTACMHVMPGFGLHEELALLCDCGMTPVEAIHAATDLAARAIQLDKHVGTIEAGKYADFVIADGDPTRNLRVLQHPWRVVRGGDLLDPAPLLAQAEHYAQTAEQGAERRFQDIY